MFDRQGLWDRMKKYGMTQSQLKLAPPDADLKLVIQHNSVRADVFFKVLYGEPEQPKRIQQTQLLDAS